MGPDVRWIGNEAGITRESEWSVVSARLQDRDTIAAASQQADGIKPISPMDEDLGSIDVLKNENSFCWYPAEVDVSIRPGWFYHPEEDNKVRSVENLLHIYESSIGGNAVLLLNIPPDTSGRINKHDEARLIELGVKLKEIYGVNLCTDATASDENGKDISFILSDNDDYWNGDSQNAVIEISFTEIKKVRRLVLCEQIRQSQRIEAFEVIAIQGSNSNLIYNGTTVGYKKICVFDPILADSIQVKITSSRGQPTIRYITEH
jgi:alpha-L-fucosidase